MSKSNKELLSDLGISVEKIHGNSGKTTCPKCSKDRKKKNDPCLSVDIEKGVYNCHNPGCGFGGIVGKSNQEPKKEYVKPVFNNRTDLPEGVVQFFQKRCISQDTLVKQKICYGPEWMPQPYGEEYSKLISGGVDEVTAKASAHKAAVVSTIQFPYFRNGELVNVKFRDGKKNFKLSKGAELIFYNLDAINDSDTVVIVEGEPDCLSFIEAGVTNVVSVPNGATLKNVNLEYLDNCIDFFNGKKMIIIATDNDEAGKNLRDELARRLGYDRCYKVDFGEVKDANEYLVAYGPEKLAEVILPGNLIEYPMAGIINIASLYDDIEFIFENGLNKGEITGFDPLDKLVSWVRGHLTVLTGIPNHGKSPLALMVMILLAKNCGWKWGVFSPEHNPLQIYIVQICEMIIGKRAAKGSITKAERKEALEFINEYFFFIYPDDDDFTLENILKKAETLVVRKGISGLLMDPWNKLEHNQPPGTSETNYISKCIDQVIRFDQRHGVHTIIVAHPTKVKKNAKTDLFEVPNLYDIAGSANWFNKPDVGITFYRNYSTKRSEIHVQKFKYQHLGSQGMSEVSYNVNNSRFNSPSADWDNTNWLRPAAEQMDMFVRNEESANIITSAADNLDNPDDLPF